MKNTNLCCQTITRCLSPGLFKALSDPNRVAILARLAERDEAQTVSEIARCCPVNLSVVSRHLSTLKEVGVLAAVKQGKEVYYKLSTGDLVCLLRRLADAFESCCKDGTCSTKGEPRVPQK